MIHRPNSEVGGNEYTGGSSQSGGVTARHEVLRHELSMREETILRLTAFGFNNTEIAVRLCLPVETIAKCQIRSTVKLGLNTRADLMRYAREHGWLGKL